MEPQPTEIVLSEVVSRRAVHGRMVQSAERDRQARQHQLQRFAQNNRSLRTGGIRI